MSSGGNTRAAPGDLVMRYLKLAIAVASASLAASCGLAPPMTTYPFPKYAFTADFPSAPTETDTTDPRNGAPIAVIDSKSLGRDFSVTVTQVDPKRDIDEIVEDAAQSTVRIVGGEITYRTYASTAEGVLGRELVISKDGRRAVRARYYRSGDRLYILSARSVMGANPTAEATGEDHTTESGADDDPAVKAFLTSFHATPAAKS
jgi:hypothetical protein